MAHWEEALTGLLKSLPRAVAIEAQGCSFQGCTVRVHRFMMQSLYSSLTPISLPMTDNHKPAMQPLETQYEPISGGSDPHYSSDNDFRLASSQVSQPYEAIELGQPSSTPSFRYSRRLKGEKNDTVHSFHSVQASDEDVNIHQKSIQGPELLQFDSAVSTPPSGGHLATTKDRMSD